MLSRRPSRLAGVALVVATALSSSACGSSEEEDAPDAQSSASADASPSESATGSPSESASAPAANAVDITFQGDEVTPQGEVVKLEVGEELLLRIQADAPGELHVHSSPEQTIDYPAGQSETPITIDRPGVVEVESHDLHKLVLQLEVR